MKGVTPMWSFLRRKCRGYLDRYVETRSYDIALQMQLDARASTARYVEDNMSQVSVFSDRMDHLDHALGQKRSHGLVCEFGVFQGHTINHIAKRVDAVVHGFDSFEGLPEFWTFGHAKGKFSTNGVLPSVGRNVKLHVGRFHDTLPKFIQEYPDDVAFVHIDCDLYSSAKSVFDHLAPRIKPGTIIVLDDYFNHPGWQQHEYRALREFVEEQKISYEYLGYCRFGMQVSVKIL